MPTFNTAISPSKPATGLTRADAFFSLALLALTFLTFSPALAAEFVHWDDPTFVIRNPRIWGGPFNLENFTWMWTGFLGGHYHPLTWLSWRLDYALYGQDDNPAAGFHFTNILLHAGAAVLVYFLVQRLILLAARGLATPGLRFASFLGAALFALHPLRAESVAWITERRDVLSAVFLICAAIAYLRSVRPGEPALAGPRAYLAAIALLVLSCLSKAWGMSFFVLMLVLDVYPLRRFPVAPREWFSPGARAVLVQKIPFLVVGLVTAALAAAAQNQALAAKTLTQWGVLERIVQSIYGLWFYTKATFWPVGLSPFYQLPERLDPWEPRFIVAYIFLAVMIVALIALRNRFPALPAAAAIYAVSLAPVLGILQSGEQLVADRYSYLACLVYSALLAGGTVSVLRWSRAREDKAANRKPFALLSLAVPSIAIVALASLAFAQTSIWKNTETLWSYAAQVTPGSQVLTNLAVELDYLKRPAEADEYARLATQINPTDGRAWFTYGGRMRDKGNLPEAERAFKEAARYMPQSYQAYQNLGVMYAKHGHHEAALEMFRLAVADVETGGRRILSGGPYMTLGLALQNAGKPDQARALFQKALAFPDTKGNAARELERMQSPRGNAGATGIDRPTPGAP